MTNGDGEELPLPPAGTYCGCPATLTLSEPSLGTLDFMDVGGGIRVSSLEVGFPTVREAVAPLPTQSGQYDYTSLYGPRVVTVAGTIVYSAYGTRHATLARLVAFCDPSLRPTFTWALDPGDPVQSLTVRGSALSAPVTDAQTVAFTVSWVSVEAYAPGAPPVIT